MSQNLFLADQAPVPQSEARIESVGVNPLDQRRVDVAVDVTPTMRPMTLRLAIVGPEDQEVSAIEIIDNREAMLDKIMHLRREAEPGAYTLHVGIFDGEELVHHVAKPFEFTPEASG